MRKLGENKKTITATPRQLEAIVRISEAHARMRYSELVERIDVAEAIRLVKAALQQAAIDPRTGTIDMDLITTGRSATARSRQQDLMRELRGLIVQRGEGAAWTLDTIHKKISEQSDMEVSVSEVREALQQLEGEDFLALAGDDRNPTIRMV
jgi:DNA replication licensing factor MCM4